MIYFTLLAECCTYLLSLGSLLESSFMLISYDSLTIIIRQGENMVLLSDRESMNRPGTLLFHNEASFFCVIVDKDAWFKKFSEGNLGIYKKLYIGKDYVLVYVFGDVLPVVLPDRFPAKLVNGKLEIPKLLLGFTNDYKIIFDLDSALNAYLEDIVTSNLGEEAKFAAFSTVRELAIFSHYRTSLTTMHLNAEERSSSAKYVEVYRSLKIPNK